MLIRHKLILNTVLVAIAMLVLSGLFLYSSQVSRHLTEAQRNVDALEIAMLNLRRAEKDFLIRKDLAFVDRFNQGLADFHKLDSLVTVLVLSTAGDVYCFRHTSLSPGFTGGGGVAGGPVAYPGKPVQCCVQLQVQCGKTGGGGGDEPRRDTHLFNSAGSAAVAALVCLAYLLDGGGAAA